MNPGDSHRLKPGTPVWVWIVRLAKGRWWPGTVEALRTIEGQLRFAVSFECRSATREDKAPVLVGTTTAATRYLEFRNIQSKGMDQPTKAPVSLLERPEEPVESKAQAARFTVSCPSNVNEELGNILSTSNGTNGFPIDED